MELLPKVRIAIDFVLMLLRKLSQSFLELSKLPLRLRELLGVELLGGAFDSLIHFLPALQRTDTNAAPHADMLHDETSN